MKIRSAVALLALISSCASFALNTTEQRWVSAVSETYGQRAAKRVETWRSNIDQFSTQSETQKLEVVTTKL